MRCGDKEGLTSAVARGQVKKHGNPPNMLYYFPRHEGGNKRTWAAEEVMSQQQERSQSDWRDYDVALRGFLGDDKSVDMREVASSSSQLSQLSITNSAPISVETLKLKRERLTKAMALTDKCKVVVEAMATPNERVVVILARLLILHEQAVLSSHELHFGATFNKNMGGEQLTENAMDKMQKKAEAITSEIVQEVKLIRALTGPNASKELL